MAITAIRCWSLRRVWKCRWKSVNYENQIFIFAKGCTVGSRLLLANCFLIAFNQSVFLQRLSFICLTVGCNFPHLYFSRNSHMYLFNEHMGAHFEETIPSWNHSKFSGTRNKIKPSHISKNKIDRQKNGIQKGNAVLLNLKLKWLYIPLKLNYNLKIKLNELLHFSSLIFEKCDVSLYHRGVGEYILTTSEDRSYWPIYFPFEFSFTEQKSSMHEVTLG